MIEDLKLGLGTAAIGRPQYINIRQNRNEEHSLDTFKHNGSELIHKAYDLGIRYFDTAPGYGMAEELMLDWRKDHHPEVEIATKWGYTYTAGFDPTAKIHEVKEHSLSKLNEQWKVSKHLAPQLKYYQIHSATLESGVLENDAVLNRLNEIKEEYGLVIGLTTTGENQLEVLQKAIEIERNGSKLFGLFQVTYNVFDQSLAAVAKDLDAKLVIKEAMANGRLFPNTRYLHYSKAYDTLEQMAEKYNVGIDAVALRFCMDSIPIYKVLIGASTNEQLTNNLQAESFEFEEEDLDLLKYLHVSPQDYWAERKRLSWN